MVIFHSYGDVYQRVPIEYPWNPSHVPWISAARTFSLAWAKGRSPARHLRRSHRGRGSAMGEICGETSQDPAVGLFIILFIKLFRSSRVHTSTDLTNNLTIVWWVLSYSDLAWVILTSLGRPVPTYPLPASSRTTEPVQLKMLKGGISATKVFQQDRIIIYMYYYLFIKFIISHIFRSDLLILLP